MSLTSGSRIGAYEILAPIGAGGMGEVYRGRDPRLARDVAIKVLRGEAALTREGRRRFEIEARAASSLNHPNILTVYDFGEDSGVLYIVCELLEGEPLRALLDRSPVSVRTLLDIAAQIADGLAAAHGAGITHRDLKPENLFVLPGGRIKILDFGLAKAAAEDVPAPDDATRTVSFLLTSPGTVAGTIAYMSPEQAMGKAVDFRSDQFSLGTILYAEDHGDKFAPSPSAHVRQSTARNLLMPCRVFPVLWNPPGFPKQHRRFLAGPCVCFAASACRQTSA
jgi:serine/threonine protein kinase